MPPIIKPLILPPLISCPAFASDADAGDPARNLCRSRTSSPSRRASRAGGSPPRLTVGGEGLRLLASSGALPGEAPTLPLEDSREGEGEASTLPLARLAGG